MQADRPEIERAVAEDYLESDVLGLIITAKCDAVHDKVSKYNYLPIVSLGDCVH